MIGGRSSTPNLEGGVNPAAPEAAAKRIEALRMLAHQQGLRFAIAALLPQIGADGRAPVMPDKGRRTEADLVDPPAASASTGPRRRPPGGRWGRTRRSAPAPICKAPCCSRECARPGGRSASRGPVRPGETITAAATGESSGGSRLGPPMPANSLLQQARPPGSTASPRRPGSRRP